MNVQIASDKQRTYKIIIDTELKSVKLGNHNEYNCNDIIKT